MTMNNIINYFKKYNIDIKTQEDILTIKDIKVPNFYKNQELIIQWEFCHLLYKLYAPYLEKNHIMYENNLYNISEKDIIFDCGANMGLFAAYAASKGAQVYAFEPMSYTRNNFLIYTQKLYPQNIKIIPFALKEIIKTEFFAQCDNPGASHDFKLKINEDNNILYTEKISCLTLDSFCQLFNIYPSFIKIDVEGSEIDLLKGAKYLLQLKKPTLSLSLYHSQQDEFTIPSQIKNLNNLYNLNFYIGDQNSLYLLCN